MASEPKKIKKLLKFMRRMQTTGALDPEIPLHAQVLTFIIHQ